MMLRCIEQHLSNTETQFMKKLSNTEAELKKRVAYRKKFVYLTRNSHLINISFIVETKFLFIFK